MHLALYLAVHFDLEEYSGQMTAADLALSMHSAVDLVLDLVVHSDLDEYSGQVTAANLALSMHLASSMHLAEHLALSRHLVVGLVAHFDWDVMHT